MSFITTLYLSDDSKYALLKVGGVTMRLVKVRDWRDFDMLIGDDLVTVSDTVKTVLPDVKIIAVRPTRSTEYTSAKLAIVAPRSIKIEINIEE